MSIAVSSRKSILASIQSSSAGDASPAPVSNTDALLRTRRPEGHSTPVADLPVDRSVAPSYPSGRASARILANMPTINVEDSAQDVSVDATNDEAASAQDVATPSEIRSSRRRSTLSPSSSNKDKQDDTQSISSRRSARGVLSAIMRKSSRSERSELSISKDSSSSASNANRRASMRLPSFRKERNSIIERKERSESAPPVPAKEIPESSAADSERSNTTVPDTSPAAEAVPAHPSETPTPPSKQNGNASNDSPQEAANGILGTATAAIAAAGASAGGAVAAVASYAGVGGAKKEEEDDEAAQAYRYDDDTDSEDEIFHDAELADIAEDDEDDEDEDRKHRGEGEEPAAVSTGAGVAGGSSSFAVAGGSKFSSVSKRRAPSISNASVNSTATSGKSKKDIPQHARDKAHRVAQLKAEDVPADEKSMNEDIQLAHKALDLFLNSHMLEAEEMAAAKADTNLYYALGYALIAVIKGFMTFEPADQATAISYCKDAQTIAGHLRKKTSAVSNFGRFIRGTGASPAGMAAMTRVQRHAELCYAETTLLKAVMGILYSGDFLGFVTEALNMRNAYGIYRALAKYVEVADEKAPHGKRDESIDEEFRSGVYLGNGLISMIFGLLPGKVLKVMEVFGYGGDTTVALATLSRAGEWSSDPATLQPGMPIEKEGLRRQICDMGILLYHLVISTFIPIKDVDVDFADKILHYNLDRYPEGVFFLYFSGRLYSTQALSAKALKQYEAARDIQEEYIQLQHICWWDMALCSMALCKWKDAYDAFTILRDDNNWSKAVYGYGKAANLYMTGAEGSDEAKRLFAEVPKLMQRIAGKSIPMEKFVARKAKKFMQQRRLLLPALELGYIYHVFSTSPRYQLASGTLDLISAALKEIEAATDPAAYHSGADEYWDDYCLAHFLRGVTLRFIAFPEPHSKVDPEESPIPIAEAIEGAQQSFENILTNAARISYDHYLIYFAHYELGRLHANQGHNAKARAEFNLILSGKTLEDKGRKGKYGMQNMCFLRSNGALASIKDQETAQQKK